MKAQDEHREGAASSENRGHDIRDECVAGGAQIDWPKPMVLVIINLNKKAPIQPSMVTQANHWSLLASMLNFLLSEFLTGGTVVSSQSSSALFFCFLQWLLASLGAVEKTKRGTVQDQAVRLEWHGKLSKEHTEYIGSTPQKWVCPGSHGCQIQDDVAHTSYPKPAGWVLCSWRGEELQLPCKVKSGSLWWLKSLFLCLCIFWQKI